MIELLDRNHLLIFFLLFITFVYSFRFSNRKEYNNISMISPIPKALYWIHLAVGIKAINLLKYYLFPI